MINVLDAKRPRGDVCHTYGTGCANSLPSGRNANFLAVRGSVGYTVGCRPCRGRFSGLLFNRTAGVTTVPKFRLGRKTLLILALLAVVSLAERTLALPPAYPTVLEISMAVGAAPGPTGAVGWRLSHFSSGGDFHVLVPNVSPSDEGRTWTIDATNAADYNVDWAALDDALDNSYWRMHGVGWSEGGFFSNHVLTLTVNGVYRAADLPTLISMDLDHIDLTLDVFRWSPVSSLRGWAATARVYGDAVLIPEPDSWLLAAGSAFGLLVVTDRNSLSTRRRSHRRSPARRSRSRRFALTGSVTSTMFGFGVPPLHQFSTVGLAPPKAMWPLIQTPQTPLDCISSSRK